MDVGALLRSAEPDRVEAVAGEDAAAAKKAAILPVGEAQLRPVEGVLTVDPAGEPIADEGRVDGLEEAVVSGGILIGDAGADQLRDGAGDNIFVLQLNKGADSVFLFDQGGDHFRIKGSEFGIGALLNRSELTNDPNGNTPVGNNAQFVYDGTQKDLWFDPDDWSAARVVVEVPLDRLDMGDARWTRAVLAPNLLDARGHPVARFASNRIEPRDASHARACGDLTVRGITRDICMDVAFNQLKRHPLPPFRRTAGFSASAGSQSRR